MDLHPEVLRRLCLGCSESRARALAMAAIRETWEETGLVLGEPDSATLRSRSPQWHSFLQHEVNPRLCAVAAHQNQRSRIARTHSPPALSVLAVGDIRRIVIGF
jgi:8-oxo-dGTP pyrophosphatase MutT (NUDIX family)